MDRRDWRETITRVVADMCIGTALLILFVLPILGAKGACGFIPEPGPTPTPSVTPPDPSPVCTPGQTCGCYHRPPGSDWIKLPDCVSGGDILQGVEWVIVAPRPASIYANQVNAALTALTGCEPQSRCIINTPMEVFLKTVAVELRKAGLYAGIQPGADEVAVGIKPSEVQGYHAFTCGPDCTKGVVGWAPGSVRDTWHAREVVGTSICPAGSPPVNKYNVKCRIRSDKYAFCDATAKVYDRVYCAPDLFCEYHGGEDSPERIACERSSLALPTWTIGDQRANNPYSADVPRGTPYKVCWIGPDGKATDPCTSGTAP